MIAYVQSVWTVIAFVLFVGIVIWAFSRGRKEDFDKAAKSVLEDDKIIQDGNDNIKQDNKSAQQ
ncbi:MAG: cbb3-type cytochrome c oxidase subunit 3 [Gammaproteobacteria bacterium]